MPTLFAVNIDGVDIVARRVELTTTTPARVFAPPLGRKAVLAKLYVWNQDTADHFVILGELDEATGTFTEIVRFRVPANYIQVFKRDEIPTVYVAYASEDERRSWAAALDSNAGAPVVVIAEFILV